MLVACLQEIAHIREAAQRLGLPGLRCRAWCSALILEVGVQCRVEGVGFKV